MERGTKKLLTFAKFAESLAELTTCKRKKVGAIIFPPNFSSVLAIGYNGQPRGQENSGCRDVSGKCGCIHAEANALIKLSTHETGLVLLATTSPCEACAGMILNQPKIETVVYLTEWRDKIGIELLKSRIHCCPLGEYGAIFCK